MASSSASHKADTSDRLFAFGPGWVTTVALVWLYVALMVLPGHPVGSGSAGAVVATITAAYAGLIAVAGPRLVRGIVLRLGGAHDPILVLGRGRDPLLSAALRPRVRLVAILAGSSASGLAAAVGAALVTGASSAAYAHAVGDVVLVVSVLLLATSTVPAPGFAGWALVLAITDALGTPPQVRVRLAARVARAMAVPIAVLTGFAAAAIAEPLLLPLGIGIAFLIQLQVHAAVSQDTLEQFLAPRTAADLARLVRTYVEVNEQVDELPIRPDGAPGVTIVTNGGALVGAVGPRQRLTARRSRGQTCGQVMVPVARLGLLPGDTTAVALLASLARHGFALVRTPDGLGYVEVTDLARQIRVAAALEARTAEAAGRWADGNDNAGSGSEDEG